MVVGHFYVRNVQYKYGRMTEKSNQNAPPEGDKLLREIRDVVTDIHEILLRNQDAKDCNKGSSKENTHQSQKVADVYLTKDDVVRLFQISPSTLAKWRYKKCIKHITQGQRNVVYSYNDLIEALANNRLVARTFNPFAAYKRLQEWYKTNVENSGHQQVKD